MTFLQIDFLKIKNFDWKNLQTIIWYTENMVLQSAPDRLL